MKRILWLTVATFAICLTTLSTYAQSSLTLRCSVPFAFTVGNTVFPAGKYEVTQPYRYVLLVRNVETQFSVFEQALPQSLTNVGGSAKVVFHRYGGEYFLTQVQVTDGVVNSTYNLRESGLEKQLTEESSHPQANVVSIVTEQGRSR